MQVLYLRLVFNTVDKRVFFYQQYCFFAIVQKMRTRMCKLYVEASVFYRIREQGGCLHCS